MPISLSSRMKEFYEKPALTKLMKKVPVAIRLDGKSFHTFTKGFDKPYDDLFLKTMRDTMKYLCENIQNCVFGYQQSDEITLILTDYETFDTAAWFDYEVQKLSSVSASMATMAFNYYFWKNVTDSFNINDVPRTPYWSNKVMDSEFGHFKLACFDSRCFNIPKEEVANLIYWRQQDATRNSIQMVGRTFLTHKEMQGLSNNDVQNVLLTKYDINWNDYPVYFKRGACCVKTSGGWENDLNIPVFTGDNREYIEKLI